jgi:hypothetical protein
MKFELRNRHPGARGENHFVVKHIFDVVLDAERAHEVLKIAPFL